MFSFISLPAAERPPQPSMQSATETVVPQDDGAVVFVSANNKQLHTISTSGLRCCIATIVCVEYNDGSKHVAFVHYSPLSWSENLKKLKDLISQIKETKYESKIDKVSAILVVPGDYQKKWFDTTNQLAPARQDSWKNAILDVIEESLPKYHVDEYVLPYFQGSLDGSSFSFMIDHKKRPSISFELKNNGYLLGK
jgi:hypothetical protein